MKSRKSQMEIFGLAVIVIIIVVGFFLVISLKSKEKIPDFQGEYTNDKQSTEYVITILNLDVEECTSQGSINVAELIKDCYTEKAIECAGMNSCQLANWTIFRIMNATLMRSNTAFNISTIGPSGHPFRIEFVNINCTNNKNKASGNSLIPLYPYSGSATLKLYVCKQ